MVAFLGARPVVADGASQPPAVACGAAIRARLTRRGVSVLIRGEKNLKEKPVPMRSMVIRFKP
jgi:hypothetical protein